MNEIQNILFIELLGGIGDVLIALSAIHALGRSHPAAQLTVLTFAPGGELLQHDRWVHRIVYAQPNSARQAVDELLAQETFDLIVSDTSYDGIAEVIGQSGTLRAITNLWQSPPSNQLVGDRFLEILLAEGVITAEAIVDDHPQIYLTATERAIARQSFGAAFRPLVLLIPDAGMPIKRWSEANFVALGQALHQKYDATVVVAVGSDQNQTERIAAAIAGSTQILQKGTLRSLAAAIAAADLVIGADTGPARIAAALNVPTITLFGPSWQGRYGQPTPHLNLQGFSECPERIISNFTQQGCWYSGQCPFQWETCLEDISVQDVLQAAVTLLGDGGLGGAEGAGGADGADGADGAGGAGGAERVGEAGLFPSSQSLVPQANFKVQNSKFASVGSWQSVRNLLVMRLDNIGDVIMTSPALQALRENLPQAKITLLASPAGTLTAPLLPWVDEVISWLVLWQDLGRLDFNPEREWELIDTLKKHQYDAAIILTSFTQSPHPAALVCALADIPLRLGESKETDIGTLTHTAPIAPDEIHQVERNLRLIESVGFSVSDRRLSLRIPADAQRTVQQKLWRTSASSDIHSKLKTQHSQRAPYILLTPWTSCQSRNYDSDRFASAARQLSELTGWLVVVTGVEKDRDRAHSLLKTLGNCAVDLIGQTNLAELVALVANAQLVLTNNTSTMHIADATRTPNVVMFAGTEQECQWQPRHSPSRLLRRPTVCSPCYAFTCPYYLQCLDIFSEEVVIAALELLKQHPEICIKALESLTLQPR
jgi:lipopolysaccharide heptosyltransferase II